MTADDVRAAAEQRVEFHERFAPLFGKEQAQDHAYTYLKGLMSCPERKSIEPIALRVGDGQVSGLQKFIGVAPWSYDGPDRARQRPPADHAGVDHRPHRAFQAFQRQPRLQEVAVGHDFRGYLQAERHPAGGPPCRRVRKTLIAIPGPKPSMPARPN
jgi:hypothetical protein